MRESLRAVDLAAFLRALKLGAVPDAGFGVSVDDIALVESAWRNLDGAVWSHGWVVALKDGRRLHLEYTLDSTRRSGPEELEIAMLRPEQSGPTLEDDAGVYWYRPGDINAYLGIAPPSLH
jgi:hypothetical protein